MKQLANQKISSDQSGLVLVSIVSIMIFLGVILIGVFGLTAANLSRSHSRIYTLQAQYAAESGVDAGIAVLNSGNDSYVGTSTDVQVLSAPSYKATYSVAVSNGNNAKEKVLTGVGKVYTPSNASTPSYVRTIKVIVQRSSTSTASSLLSRNILALDSSVKDVKAKDIYINGFITMAKNTNNLTAENIFVGGKDTGANNCSIEGPGNLVKPSSFSNPSQTKTNITTAYNNCINPPGNSSNSNFNVAANQNTVTAVQSTYVPWSQYMDSSYQNSPGGCNDWTSGTSPRDIPSTGNTKKTHYPNSSSNVSTSCGTNGDLSLGSARYNIRDNVHVRANLCAASQCTPTFYNPDPTLKYVFIEGSVNFGSLTTASGSGPIAFIIYGADPASKTSVCPYGGAAYLANSGTTSAPGIYLLATNGVCLDKTRFGTAPALGGVGGKNIYIATNSGTPFDLSLNPDFPVDELPIDLSWRAVSYQKL